VLLPGPKTLVGKCPIWAGCSPWKNGHDIEAWLLTSSWWSWACASLDYQWIMSSLCDIDPTTSFVQSFKKCNCNAQLKRSQQPGLDHDKAREYNLLSMHFSFPSSCFHIRKDFLMCVSATLLLQMLNWGSRLYIMMSSLPRDHWEACGYFTSLDACCIDYACLAHLNDHNNAPCQTLNNICVCQIKADNGTRNVLIVVETIDDVIVMSMFLHGASRH
jgi:hypothetical protein